MTTNSSVIRSAHFDRQLRKFTVISLVTLFTLIVVSVYLMPFANMVTVSLRDGAALSQTQDSSVLPMMPVTFNYEGEDYPIYEVPINEEVKQLALIKATRPAASSLIPITWTPGSLNGKATGGSLQPCKNSARAGKTTSRRGTRSTFHGCSLIRWSLR